MPGMPEAEGSVKEPGVFAVVESAFDVRWAQLTNVG